MDSERTGYIKRATSETEVEISINLDKKGQYTINTGIPFLNHLLEAFAKHGGFNLTVYAQGDIEVDFHHLVEDIGIALGKVLAKAITDKSGIKRYSTVHIPMDESLVRVSIDISGRSYLNYDVELNNKMILHFDGDLIEEFFRGFVQNASITMHIDKIRGKNSHHILEAVFKAFGIALKDAVSIKDSEGDIPSTKGIIE